MFVPHINTTKILNFLRADRRLLPICPKMIRVIRFIKVRLFTAGVSSRCTAYSLIDCTDASWHFGKLIEKSCLAVLKGPGRCLLCGEVRSLVTHTPRRRKTSLSCQLVYEPDVHLHSAGRTRTDLRSLGINWLSKHRLSSVFVSANINTNKMQAPLTIQVTLTLVVQIWGALHKSCPSSKWRHYGS